MIQARGADGLTLYYFWSEGSGTELDPFKSKQLAVQSGDWDVSVNNLPDVFPVSFNWQGLTDTELRAAPLVVTGDFYQDVQPVTIAGGSNITVEVGSSIEATQSGTWNINNVSGVISLPTGAATENTLTAIDAKLPSNLTVVGDRLQVDADVALPQVFPIDGSVSVDNFPVGLATDAVLTAISNKVPAGLAVVGDRLKVDANVTLPSTYAVTGAVEITNTAVPVVGSVTVDNQLTGLATEAKQDTLIAKLPAGLTVENSRLKVDANVNLPASYPVTGTVGISNFPVVQEVSGSVTADTGLVQPLTNTELRASPLEVDIDVSLLATEQTLTSLSSKVPQLTLTGDRLKVDANINAQTDIAVNNYSTLVTALEAATLQAEVVNNVSVITDQLIDTTGLATSANQTIANSTLSTINTKLPSNLTVTSTRLLVDGSGVTQPVSLATLPAGSNTIGSIANTTFASTQSGTWTVGINNFPVTQEITGTVTANTGLTPLTNTELRASDVSTIINANQSILLSDLLYYAQSHNLINGKFAAAYTLLANRTTFANTTAYHDLCEFLTSTTVFIPVTTSDSLEIVSSSASDTVGGTGTHSVKITYLNNAGLLTESAAINLNGTTPVSAGFTASAILWMEAWQGGSGTVSAGNITLRNVATPTTIYEQITAGGNKSLSGRFTVPSNCTAYLVDYDFAAISQTMDIRLRATTDTYTRLNNNGRYLFQVRKFLASGQNVAQDGRFLKFGAGSSIKISAIPGATAGNPRCDANFTLLVVEN